MIDTHPVIFIFIIHNATIDNTFIIKDNVYDIVSVDTSRIVVAQP